jgi:hypothetical protein
VEGFNPKEEHRAGTPPPIKASVYALRQACYLLRRLVTASESKLLVVQLPALVYFSDKHNE